jgi:hypothetical protein
MYLSVVDIVSDAIGFIVRFFSGLVDIISVGVSGLVVFVNFVGVGFNKFMALFDDFFDVVNGASPSVQLILGVAGFTVLIFLAKYFASVFFKG